MNLTSLLQVERRRGIILCLWHPTAGRSGHPALLPNLAPVPLGAPLARRLRPLARRALAPRRPPLAPRPTPARAPCSPPCPPCLPRPLPPGIKLSRSQPVAVPSHILERLCPAPNSHMANIHTAIPVRTAGAAANSPEPPAKLNSNPMTSPKAKPNLQAQLSSLPSFTPGPYASSRISSVIPPVNCDARQLAKESNPSRKSSRGSQAPCAAPPGTGGAGSGCGGGSGAAEASWRYSSPSKRSTFSGRHSQ